MSFRLTLQTLCICLITTNAYQHKEDYMKEGLDSLEQNFYGEGQTFDDQVYSKIT